MTFSILFSSGPLRRPTLLTSPLRQGTLLGPSGCRSFTSFPSPPSNYYLWTVRHVRCNVLLYRSLQPLPSLPVLSLIRLNYTSILGSLLPLGFLDPQEDHWPYLCLFRFTLTGLSKFRPSQSFRHSHPVFTHPNIRGRSGDYHPLLPSTSRKSSD